MAVTVTSVLLLALVLACANSAASATLEAVVGAAAVRAAAQQTVQAAGGPSLFALNGQPDQNAAVLAAAAQLKPEERRQLATAVTDYLKQVFADRPEALARIQQAWDGEFASDFTVSGSTPDSVNVTASDSSSSSSRSRCPTCEAINALYEADHPYFESRMQELVVGRGYPLERHTVVTPDGYELVMFRIPHGAQRNTEPGNKPVIMLHHGITLASDCFAVFRQNESLAFILADAGFDVWLANTRGNTYSRRNVNLYTYQPEFWYFSIDQLALLDLPTQVDYALQASGASKLGFVGHSQGSTLVLKLCAAKPEYNNKFSVLAHMGPVFFGQFIEAPFLRTAVNLNLEQLLYTFQIGEFVPNRLTAPIAGTLCSSFPLDEVCAAAVAFLTFGPSMWITPDDYLEVGRTWPSSVGSRNIIHWAQIIRTPELEVPYFNFGTTCNNIKWRPLRGIGPKPFRETCNQAEYGSTVPPTYDLSKVTAPNVYFLAQLDVLATPTDVDEQKKRIGAADAASFLYANYGHMDFIWDRNAKHAADLADVLFRFSPGTF